MSLATIEKRKIDKLFSLHKKEMEAFMNAIDKDLKNPDMICAYSRSKHWQRYDKSCAKLNCYLRVLQEQKNVACWATIIAVKLYKAVGHHGKDKFIKALNIYGIEVI